jgi:FixJ family two-component response regulator
MDFWNWRRHLHAAAFMALTDMRMSRWAVIKMMGMDAIQLALDCDRATRQEAELASLRERFESLTNREREILPLAVSGFLNKQISAEIGISLAAVKVHRSQLIRKMGAQSLG